MIAQPYYGTKLRFRSDYENNKNRLGVLKNRTTNSSYQGPAIRVNLFNYLNLLLSISLIRFHQIISIQMVNILFVLLL